MQILCNILDSNHIERTIIFCKTRIGTNMLAEKLMRQGYDAKPLHGGLTQTQRDFISNSLRKRKLKFLVATDVAARGLGIQGITHIINYDIPLDALVYFHRIGRTARMGREGTAITFVGYGEIPELNRIKALTKTTIEELESDIQVSYSHSLDTHKAVCTDCGNECEVLFKPDPNSPVYCRECSANDDPQ